MIAPLRGLVIAYVCEGGVMHPTNDMGERLLEHVYAYRPKGCRYVVMKVRKKYWMIDLNDLHMHKVSVHATTPTDICAPGYHRIFDNEDAAIAAAVMIHDTLHHFVTRSHKK